MKYVWLILSTVGVALAFALVGAFLDRRAHQKRSKDPA